MNSPAMPERQIEPDGALVDILALPADAASLQALLRELFVAHGPEIDSGATSQGAPGKWKGARAPGDSGMMDGCLSAQLGVPHCHICIGNHRGSRAYPVSPEPAPHRRTSRAELY